MTRRRLATLAALVAGAVAGLAACEVPLDPIEPSDFVFTMGGYLDASADTQWVRVEPLARTTDPEPGPIDADVTLEDLASGATVALEQEVRTFVTGPAHLFRTTAPVVPGGRYRVTATGASGQASSALVELPTDGTFAIDVTSGVRVCPATVTVTGAENVVDVQARYVVERDGRRTAYAFSHADTFEPAEAGGVRASVYFGDDAERMGLDAVSPVGLVSSEVVVAVSKAGWPNLAGLSVEQQLQGRSYNVENGLGFVGGAITERRPFVPGVLEFGFGEVRPCVRP